MDPSISTTAQVLGDIATLTPSGIEALVLSMILFALMSVPVQAMIEGAIASLLPSWAFAIKPAIPAAVSYVVAHLATIHGLPGLDADAGGVALAGALHWVNAQDWAVALEGKNPKLWTTLLSIIPKGAAAPAAGAPPPPSGQLPGRNVGLLLALGLGLCASSLHAQAGLSLSGLFGSSAWDVQDGGKWVGNGSTLAGAEINLGFGSTDTAGAFNPVGGLLLGVAGENQTGTNYGDVILGGGLAIPDTANIPLTLAADWRMFSGKRYPAVMVGVSIPFGKPFWVSK